MDGSKYVKLDLNVTNTEYTVTGLEAGKEYTFFVQAYSTKWLPGGDESTIKVTTQSAAANEDPYPILKAAPTANSVTLTWDPVKDATKYGVYKVVNGKYTKLDLNVTGTEFTITGLNPGTQYTFFVQAYTTKWLPSGDESTIITTTLS